MSQLGNCSGGPHPEKYGASHLVVRYEPIVALKLDPQNPQAHGGICWAFAVGKLPPQGIWLN